MKTDTEGVTGRGAGVLMSHVMVDADRCYMFQNLATLVTPSIQSVVEFAKRVPGQCLWPLVKLSIVDACWPLKYRVNRDARSCDIMWQARDVYIWRLLQVSMISVRMTSWFSSSQASLRFGSLEWRICLTTQTSLSRLMMAASYRRSSSTQYILWVSLSESICIARCSVFLYFL